MAEAIKETKLILAKEEAETYVGYLMGFQKTLADGGVLWLGLGNIRVEEGAVNPNDPSCDGKHAVFEEIPFDTAATEDGKTTNYARVLVRRVITAKEGGTVISPNLLTVDSNNSRRVYNHEQIVFNKVKTTQYTANAIGLFRTGTNGAKPFAFGLLESKLTATVGSLPMFERGKLILCMPDGGDLEIPA